MTVKRQYECDLCGIVLEPRKLLGIKWDSANEISHTTKSHDSEHHICFLCLSSLQMLTKVCGQGYPCGGGPRCQGDHK